MTEALLRDGAQPPCPSGRTVRARERATLAAASIGFAVIQLDVTVVNVAVRQIGAGLHAGVAALQWTVSAYTLTLAALILTAGALGDRFGARRVFAAGFVAFVLASLACGLAASVTELIGARAIQGVGAALLGSCSLALLNHTFHDPRRRARALATWAAGASGALSAGPVIGGLLIASLGWRTVFFINLPIGALGLWLTLRRVEETPRCADRRLDVAGSLAATVALAGLAAALIETGRTSIGSPPALVGLGVFAAAALAFLLRERRAREPMLPLGLLAHRRFIGPGVIGLLVNAGFYGLLFVFSLLLQSGRGFSALETGLSFLPMTIAILAGNLASGRVTGWAGAPRAVATAALVMMAGAAGLLRFGPGSGLTALLAEQVLLGAGLGLLVPPLTGVLMGSVERARSGIASGALTTMRQTGSMLGVAVFGSLVAGGENVYSGLHVAAAATVGLMAASALLAGRG